MRAVALNQAKKIGALGSEPIGAAFAAAGAADADPRRARKSWPKLAGDPNGNVLERGVFQPINLIEHAVIERFAHAFERLFDHAEIGNPPGRRIGRAGDRHLDLIGVTVHALIAMPLGHMLEMMRRLEGERFGDFNARRHGAAM